MSLIQSKQKPAYRWRAGDLISPGEAAALCGYRSAKQFTDPERLSFMAREFQSVGCTLTTDISIGDRRRFLRREIDAYLSKLVENAQKRNEVRVSSMRLAA